ncbi:MAG: 4-hydroxybenzoate polyprenyltransferase [Chlamydiales bacterium]|jgi:4-hydroxybenzoate polyprenyltransferase|nr:4-hydroxybenzoate polyprenyltransferase [Chlamydiales bacterium]
MRYIIRQKNTLSPFVERPMPLHALNRLLLFKESLFGLPWIASSALLAIDQYPLRPEILLFVLIAFLAARSFGMGLNRLVDVEIDRRNPRTQDRPFVTGEVSEQALWLTLAGSLTLFLLSCLCINALTLYLAAPALFFLSIYSYTKRFTYLCHFFLGLVHFFGPLMTWAALTGTLALTPFLLSLSLFCLISATDIIYAFQDQEWDRKNGIFSIPSAFSTETSLKLAQGLHALFVAALLLLGWHKEMPLFYYLAPLLLFALLYKMYRQLNLEKRECIPQLFFRLNALSGMIQLSFIAGSLVWENTL